MASELDRRDRRYPFEISGTIVARKGELAVVTGDVSFRGAFLKTTLLPEVRQLIRVRLALPAEFEPTAARRELLATGMVAHVVQVRDAKGRHPGAGVEFYGLDGELRERWERFIQYVQTHDESKEPAVNEAQARRRREGARLDVQLLPIGAAEKLEAEGHVSTTQDVSPTGMFIRTNVAMCVGAGLVVNLFDPTSREGFHLDCVVRRRVFGTNAGLEVEFLEMAPATWSALAALLEPVVLTDAPMVTDRTAPTRRPLRMAARAAE